MASTSNRIPAWRRLGLALKNEDQSGVAVTASQTLDSESGHIAASQTSRVPVEQVQPSAEPAVNGKSSRLGKRKHQTEPAEEQVQSSKKTRTTNTEGDILGDAGHGATAITKPHDLDTDTSNARALPAESPQPKGDPNYRKKKARPAKRRRNDLAVAQAESAPAPPPDELTSGLRNPASLASTESTHNDSAQFATPKKPVKPARSTNKDPSGSPPHTDRRKSVAFTPDTKTDDGNSGQELFKKWVAEQKGTGAVSAPPPVSDFTLHSLIAEEEKVARRNGQLDKSQPIKAKAAPEETPKSVTVNPKQPQANSTSEEEAETVQATKATSSTPKGKKKDPSVYIAYLIQYHSDRDNWKFNKAKQNDVVDNALNIFRIPDKHSDALLKYVAGLQGAGVIERLQDRCNATLKELDEQDARMDDAEARKVAQEEAEQERIAKEQKRRKVEGDVEAFVNHPHSDGYIRRLRRARAQALLNALGRTAPILPANTQTNGINSTMKSLAPQQRDSKKRKRRGEVSSDESSSESSSDEDSSSSDSESDHSDNLTSASEGGNNSSGDDASNSDSDSDSD